MAANKLEAFEITEVDRESITEAEYNPRKISEASLKKLKKFMKNNGLWSPLVMNKRTGTLVSGHQRIAAMDTILRSKNYRLTVAMVDVDEQTEITGNIFLNNQSAMGEWDFFKLEDIHANFPEIDFSSDLAFDEIEIDLILGEEKVEQEQKQEQAQEYTTDNFREAKKMMRERAKEENNTGSSYRVDENDYQVTIVFPNNQEKQNFMRKVKKPEREKFLKSTVLFDIANGVYNLSVLQGEG